MLSPDYDTTGQPVGFCIVSALSTGVNKRGAFVALLATRGRHGPG